MVSLAISFSLISKEEARQAQKLWERLVCVSQPRREPATSRNRELLNIVIDIKWMLIEFQELGDSAQSSKSFFPPSLVLRECVKGILTSRKEGSVV